MMNMMMPLMFGYITLTLPSGLGLYYVLSNLIGMVMQYVYVGGGPFNWRALVGLSKEPVLPRAADVGRRRWRPCAASAPDEPPPSGGGKKRRPSDDASTNGARRNGPTPPPDENGASAPESSSAGARGAGGTRVEGVEAEGRTVNEATEKALAELGLRRDQVDVEVLSEGRPRLLGFRGEPARVRVTPLASAPPAAPPPPESPPPSVRAPRARRGQPAAPQPRKTSRPKKVPAGRTKRKRVRKRKSFPPRFAVPARPRPRARPG